ncbi:MAG: substrate-binding domain-containing protein [Bradyrhizobium sp.]|nr:substrate-binding domain-containing protein [Bradyrhizobium sp.]
MQGSVRVLSTLALAGAVGALAERYRAKSGVRIDADFAPTVRLLERLKEGETADVLILTDEGLAGLISDGNVIPESRVDVARSWVGLAVAAGRPLPDISTEAALRATLLAARSVAYSRLGASGIFFAQLIAKMGIEKEINHRATVVPMGFTAERVVAGDADVAIQQISELKQVKGIEIVGPLPRHLQTPAVFSAGRMAGSKQIAASDLLLTFLCSPEATPALLESGLERLGQAREERTRCRSD